MATKGHKKLTTSKTRSFFATENGNARSDFLKTNNGGERRRGEMKKILVLLSSGGIVLSVFLSENGRRIYKTTF